MLKRNDSRRYGRSGCFEKPYNIKDLQVLTVHFRMDFGGTLISGLLRSDKVQSDNNPRGSRLRPVGGGFKSLTAHSLSSKRRQFVEEPLVFAGSEAQRGPCPAAALE